MEVMHVSATLHIESMTAPLRRAADRGMPTVCDAAQEISG
jgi:hypothetical protein